jgi:hypothetical protein
LKFITPIYSMGSRVKRRRGISLTSNPGVDEVSEAETMKAVSGPHSFSIIAIASVLLLAPSNGFRTA